jgi:hypothetical protein
VTLKITATRVHICTPEQTSYWVLPSQKVTFAISDMPDLDEACRKLPPVCGPRTPLDE